jgi:O-antigen/teichoic acid export membrane protein
MLWILSSNVATKLLWAGSIVVLMHGLGPEGYGSLVTVWAFAGLMAGISDLGTGQAFLRKCSREGQATLPYLRTTLFIKTWLTTPLWVLVALVALWFRGTCDDWTWPWVATVGLAALAPLIDHFQTVFTAITQMLRRLDLYAIWRAAYFLGVFFSFASVLALGGSTLGISLAYCLVTVAYVIRFGHKALHLIDGQPGEAPGRYPLNSAIREGLPFLGTTLLALAYYRVDVMLLGFLGSEREAGIYAGQYQLILLFYMIPGALFSVLFPDLYRCGQDRGFLQEQFDKNCRYLNLLSWLATPCLFFQARGVMNILGGGAFASEYRSLQVLCFFIPMVPFAVALNFLTATDRLTERMGCEIGALAVTFLGGVLVIPVYSTIGMASIALLAYALSGVLALTTLVRKGRIRLGQAGRDWVGMSLRIIPALMVFGLPVSIWWLQAVFFIAAALLSLTVSRFWNRADAALLQHAWTRLRRTA